MFKAKKAPHRKISGPCFSFRQKMVIYLDIEECSQVRRSRMSIKWRLDPTDGTILQ